MKDRGALAMPASGLVADFFPASELNGKWMLGLLTRAERALVRSLATHPGIRSFADVARVDVGIVTGANSFFLVPDAVVAQHGLHEGAGRMCGRGEHVPGVVYDRRTHDDNRGAGLPAHFLHFGARPLAELSRSAGRYTRAGGAQGLHRRYKCR